MEGNGIYKAILGVMADIGAISKDKKNQQQGFMYRGIDDVMNALQPLLVKYKVFIVPEIMEQSREERTSKNGGLLVYSVCTIRYTFYSDDGSSIAATVVGEGMDSGDKATNKAMAIAFKYVCFQVFCIPTEEMSDPDSESPELGERKKQSNEHEKTSNDKNPEYQAKQRDGCISEAQAKRLFAIAKGDNKDEKISTINSVLGMYQYDHSSKVQIKDYDAICEQVVAGLPF